MVFNLHCRKKLPVGRPCSFLDQELISYRYSSCSSSCWGWLTFEKPKAPWFQIGSGWNLTGMVGKYAKESIDGVGFSIWRCAFKMAAMASLHAEKCCHLASQNKASSRRLCSSIVSSWSIVHSTWIRNWSHIATHLVVLLPVGEQFFKKPKANISNRIGMKFGGIVLQASTHRLTESDFHFSIWRHNFKMAAMMLFHPEKCHCMVSEHESSAGACATHLERPATRGDDVSSVVDVIPSASQDMALRTIVLDVIWSVLH